MVLSFSCAFPIYLLLLLSFSLSFIRFPLTSLSFVVSSILSHYSIFLFSLGLSKPDLTVSGRYAIKSRCGRNRRRRGAEKVGWEEEERKRGKKKMINCCNVKTNLYETAKATFPIQNRYTHKQYYNSIISGTINRFIMAIIGTT